MSVKSFLADQDGVIVDEGPGRDRGAVTIPAQDLMWAVGAVARHRAKAAKDESLTAIHCLFVSLDQERSVDRAVIAATNRYSAAIATTDSRTDEGEPYLSPDDPCDVWADLATAPGAFADAACAGVFNADRSPVRDIDRLSESDPEADITLRLTRWNLRVQGPGGHLLWPRIDPPATLFDPDADAALIPDLPGIFANLVGQLPTHPQGHDVTYATSLLRLLENLSGPHGRLRFVQPSSGTMTLVTAAESRTPRLGIIGPMRAQTEAEDHV